MENLLSDIYEKTLLKENKEGNFSQKRIAILAMEQYGKELIDVAADMAFDSVLVHANAKEARRIEKSILSLVERI